MKTRNRFFILHPQKAKEMLQLRRDGWSVYRLAEYYEVDPAGIFRRCKLAGIEPPKHPIRVGDPLSFDPRNKPRETDEYYMNDGEKIRKGKSYKQYLKIAGLKKPALFR